MIRCTKCSEETEVCYDCDQKPLEQRLTKADALLDEMAVSLKECRPSLIGGYDDIRRDEALANYQSYRESK